MVEVERESPFDESGGIITFRTRAGKMSIRIASFFPCSNGKLMKLLKIMGQANNSPEDLEQIRKVLIEEFEERIQGNEQALPGHAKAYFENKQKASDIAWQLEHGKYANGLPIPKDARKGLRIMQKVAASVASLEKGYFDTKQRLIRDLKKNLETMKAVEL